MYFYTLIAQHNLGSLPTQKGKSFDKLLTFFTADTDKEYAASIKYV